MVSAFSPGRVDSVVIQPQQPQKRRLLGAPEFERPGTGMLKADSRLQQVHLRFRARPAGMLKRRVDASVISISSMTGPTRSLQKREPRPFDAVQPSHKAL